MRSSFFSKYRIVFFFLFLLIFPLGSSALDSLHYNLSVTYPIENLNTIPGDIIVRDRYSNTLWLSAVEDSPDVFGVVVENPMLMFRTESGSVPVIRMGQTPVNVILKDGPIERGDNITTSDVSGFGQAVQGHHRYTLGIALESLDEDDTEEVVTLANGETYPSGLIMVDLRIGRHGSAVVSKTPSEVTPSLSETSFMDLIIHDVGAFQYMGSRAVDMAREFLQTDVGVTLAQMVSILGIIAGFFLTLTSLFFSSLRILEIILLPFRLWALFVGFLGFKKRLRPWGVVYDSVTKQPIDPAYVQLQDEDGNDIKTSITDIDGRYGFLVEPGRYRLKVNKTNYSFPSKKLKGKRSDVIYDDLYFGEIFEINDKVAIAGKNVPMDPDKFDWNEFAKLNKKILNYYSYGDFFKAVILNWFFYIGFIFSLVALLLMPTVYNIIIVSLYLLLMFVRMIRIKPRRLGKVVNERNGEPLPFAIVRIRLVDSGNEAYKVVCDAYGRYFSLVTNGFYYVSIDCKEGEDSYRNVYTSEPFEVKDGIIRETFKVDI